MQLEIPSLRLRIIDSLNFIQGSLSSFPETFDLQDLKKGYFPHYFNRKENQNYVGSIPATKYYGVDSMKDCGKCKSEKICTHEHTRNHFIQWHKERVKENYVFDFKKEIAEYCHSDANILRRGFLEFRKNVLEIANIDPFQQPYHQLHYMLQRLF